LFTEEIKSNGSEEHAEKSFSMLVFFTPVAPTSANKITNDQRQKKESKTVLVGLLLGYRHADLFSYGLHRPMNRG
jgi:hypothetical protein